MSAGICKPQVLADIHVANRLENDEGKMALTNLRRPDFLIVGAKRSGTSALFSMLRGHPGVFRGDKEIHYFDYNYDKEADWYFSHFGRATESEIAGEATQTYMFDPAIPRRIAEVAPEARLIAILRNPIDRAYSDYSYAVARGLEDLSFEEAINEEPVRMAASYEGFLSKSYVSKGLYYDQIVELNRWFPRDRIHVVIFEEMVREPGSTFRDLCQYLSIDTSIQPDALGAKVNATTSYRSLRLRRLTMGRRNLAARVAARLNRHSVGYPAMSPATRKHLYDFYSRPNQALVEWLDRSLDTWSD